MLRRARERQRLSLGELAGAAGVAVGYLSLVENGRREPSLAFLRRVGHIVDLEPVVVLLPRADRTVEQLQSMRARTPGQRLTSAAPSLYDALARLVDAFPSELTVSGAAAAVAQGVPLAVECLDVVLPDTDDVVERLIEVLRRSFAIYAEMSVAEYRALGRSLWPVGSFDVNVQLSQQPPLPVPVDLGGWVVPLMTLTELAAAEPAVAALVERLASTHGV